jgi:hypothetical protein
MSKHNLILQEQAEERTDQNFKLMCWLLYGRHINTTQTARIFSIGNSSSPRRIKDIKQNHKIEIEYGKEEERNAYGETTIVSCYYIMPDKLIEMRLRSGLTNAKIKEGLFNSVHNLNYILDDEYTVTQEWVNTVTTNYDAFKNDSTAHLRKIQADRRAITSFIAGAKVTKCNNRATNPTKSSTLDNTFKVSI